MPVKSVGERDAVVPGRFSINVCVRMGYCFEVLLTKWTGIKKTTTHTHAHRKGVAVKPSRNVRGPFPLPPTPRFIAAAASLPRPNAPSTASYVEPGAMWWACLI